jgi:hypothetical protein
MEKKNFEEPQQIPTIVNHISALNERVNDSVHQNQIQTIKYEMKTRNKKEVVKKKIILIGDSHKKGYASQLASLFDKKFVVMGIVMPGARLQNIIKLCEQEVSSLTKDDIVLLWGGSNDVAKNETTKGLNRLKKLTNMNRNTNILLITVPYRCDLTEFSCVNKEIKVFNRKMHKIKKL